MSKIGKTREKSGKERKIGENLEKEEKLGRKGQNQEGSFTLPLLTNRAGYATGYNDIKVISRDVLSFDSIL